MGDEEEYKAEYLDTAEEDEPEVLHTYVSPIGWIHTCSIERLVWQRRIARLCAIK